MAGPVGKSALGDILLQAKCAAKNNRAQRDLLLQFQLQLQTPGDAARLKEIISGLVDVSFKSVEAGARYLTTCLTLAASNGVPPSLPHSFAVLSDEKLFDRLVALRLPRRPVTQAHAFARIEAFYAVKLPQEHHLQRCIEHLAKIGRPATAATEPPQDSNKIGLPAPATAATGEPPQAASTNMDQARTYLDRACTLANLAVKHIDLAVTSISSFLDPKEVASISDFADHFAVI